MDLTGRTLLGKYEIEGLLGQGGMGAVWRARHALTGRKLAIKTLDAAYFDNPAVVSRFGREARAASACEHPGIVEVLDLDRTEDGIPFLVMEFLEGETLARRIERRGRLDQEELTRLGAMLLEALDAAHAHGVIHRDLKPENIYVVPAGRRGEIVKILDFGISHKRDEADEKLTMTGSVLGTPHYMSPEQAMGEAEIDHRADLYAVGVVLYECAVGDVPFDAPNYNKLLRTILDQTAVSPRRRGAQISAEVERLIAWAMEKDRTLRVGSAREMNDWLARTAAGEMPPYAQAAPSSPSMAGFSAAAFAPAGTLPAPRALGPTLGDGELTAHDSWRPSANVVTERSLEPLDALSRQPQVALELDESALRASAPPAPAGGTTTGSHSAVGVVDRTGGHRIVSEPPPATEGSSFWRYVLWGLIVLAIGAGIVFSARYYLHQRAPAPPIGPSPVQREAPTAAPSWVSVRITGLPPNARVELDGLPATSPVRVRRGGHHVMEIRAPGYADRRHEFRADHNLVLPAEMHPAPP